MKKNLTSINSSTFQFYRAWSMLIVLSALNYFWALKSRSLRHALSCSKIISISTSAVISTRPPPSCGPYWVSRVLHLSIKNQSVEFLHQIIMIEVGDDLICFCWLRKEGSCKSWLIARQIWLEGLVLSWLDEVGRETRAHGTELLLHWECRFWWFHIWKFAYWLIWIRR